MEFELKKLFLILIIILSGTFPMTGQESLEEMYGLDYYTVVFWNLENYFDTRPDPVKEDKDFTAGGSNRWTRKRFIRKREGVSKTIMAIDPWSENLATIIGLAEVENRYVLNQLLYETPLFMGDYRIVHQDSPDRRGIDVALMYRKRLFRSLETRFMAVQTGTNDEFSRDILYVKGVLHDLDTLHVFVNHWPSKYGGEKISTPKRIAAAQVLAGVCDSILEKNQKANILVMGDFNDTPQAEVFRLLNGVGFVGQDGGAGEKPKGTIKYLGTWEKIDHFLASQNLLDQNEPISISSDDSYIYSAGHLFERDRKYTGNKPKRTYIGPRYNGGLSDHLPIVIKIMRNW